MNSKPEPGVAAPCGLFCDNCDHSDSDESAVCCSVEFCPSHLGRDQCEIYRCCVTKGGMTDCAACVGFPCAALLAFVNDSRHRERLPLMLNLQRRRRLGRARWLAEERSFWQRTESALQWARLQRVLAEKWSCLEDIRRQVGEITSEVEQATQGRSVEAPVERVGSQV